MVMDNKKAIDIIKTANGVVSMDEPFRELYDHVISSLESIEELKRLCDKGSKKSENYEYNTTTIWLDSIIDFINGDPTDLKKLAGDE